VALEYLPGWWCNNHLEKYEFVNGVGMTSQKIKFMFENHTSQHFFYYKILKDLEVTRKGHQERLVLDFGGFSASSYLT